MAELPAGTRVPSGRFLFTDVEGSTRLWEQHPEEMRPALARHDALIEAEVDRHGGAVVRPRGEGDSRFAVFARASDAVAAAAATVVHAPRLHPGPNRTVVQTLHDYLRARALLLVLVGTRGAGAGAGPRRGRPSGGTAAARPRPGDPGHQPSGPPRLRGVGGSRPTLGPARLESAG